MEEFVCIECKRPITNGIDNVTSNCSNCGSKKAGATIRIEPAKKISLLNLLDTTTDVEKGHEMTDKEKLESMSAQINSLLDKLRLLKPPVFLHDCPEWDFMLIDEYCVEFEVCGCYSKLVEHRKEKLYE